MLFRGHFECLVSILSLERTYLKKTLFDQILREKNQSRIKNMDVKHGSLVSSVYQDNDTVNRFENFIIRVQNLFDQYARDIIDKYRQILMQQDANKRTPLHYGAMSKFTKCYKALEAMLSIDVDEIVAQGFDFVHLFQQVQDLDTKEEARFDPRKYKNVLEEFKHLLNPIDYKRVVNQFKTDARAMLKQALNIQDVNYHTPLHISSYFGDFKSSRLFVEKGADAASDANAEAPLNIGKNKFARDVLQSLNDAAKTGNDKDLNYLVNCGEDINSKSSI